MKVWFIKNYMSPQMRAFVPRMAQHYGFDYEFVTYKWPSWLHKQVHNLLHDVLYCSAQAHRAAGLMALHTEAAPVVGAGPAVVI